MSAQRLSMCISRPFQASDRVALADGVPLSQPVLGGIGNAGSTVARKLERYMLRGNRNDRRDKRVMRRLHLWRGTASGTRSIA